MTLFVLLAAQLLSCIDDTSTLGHSLVESSFRNAYVDTCTVDLSTIHIDSLVTRGDSVCQIGHYRDTLWGDITSRYYAEVNTVLFSPQDNYSYTLDSLVLRFSLTGHYRGDTLTTQHVTAYRMKYPINLTDDDDLYNTTSLALDPEPLFSFQFNPRPGERKEYEIRLPDAIGRRILSDLVADAEYFDSQDKFRDYFPGLAFVPDTPDDCISGLLVNDSSMIMMLHYDEVGNYHKQNTLIFTLNTDHAYIGITHNPSGTYLEEVRGDGIEQAVHSSSMGHRAYLQGLTGFYNQIDFPFLNNLQDMGDVVSIEQAALYLYPLAGSYDEDAQLPDELRIYITDENNALEDYTYGDEGVTVQTGSLVKDELFGRETYYMFDLTEFIRNNFGTWGSKRQKLLLSLPGNELYTTFNSVLFTNDPSLDRQCRLAVRFKTYREN